MTIGARIREWRKKRDIAVPELARKVGLKPSTIYGMEISDQISSTKLHHIARELRVSVHYLETGRGDPEDLHIRQPAATYDVSWPFSFPRERFDRLDGQQKLQIQGAVLNLILEFEGRNTRRKSRKVG